MAKHDHQLTEVEKKFIDIGVVLAFLVLALVVIWAFKPHTPNLPSPSLKDLAAQHNIQLGNYASLKRLNDKPYTNILTSQYSFVTVDGELNWTFNDGSLRPTATTYDFTNPDAAFAFAQSHQLPVQGHHLVWGEEKWLPDWLKKGNYSKDDLLNLIHEHIQAVVGHYKGQVREWSVVNEPFSRAQHVYGLHDWWADHIGDQSYIDQSFIWAHQADPQAKLFIGDFNNEEQNSISDAMYNYVKGAKARHIPIDGIAMQMHLDGTRPINKEGSIQNMQRFGRLGLKVYVTELDVNMSFLKASPAQRDQTEAQIYHDAARACIESKVCVSFASLGISDKESWYNDLGFKNADPLLFDSRYRPKPAFYSFRDAWQQP
jgi:endo-1,4-beta-xylanase